jgi:predicted DCC family thiol-disulfide oxidoreductase YuxK
MLMDMPWPLLGWLVSFIPVWLAHALYDKFAAKRFDLFGGTEEVQQYPAEADNLFIDSHEGIHACPIPSKKKC